MSAIEAGILKATDPHRQELFEEVHRLHDISLGITPLNPGDPRDSGVKCGYCGKPETASEKKMQLCSQCRMVSYCSAECQRAHWKESHKAVCLTLNEETEEEGKRIVREMEQGDVSSMITLQRSDAVYDMAKKHGLFRAMEQLFCWEVDGVKIQSKGCYYSGTQGAIINVFKGNREVVDRFTCACPYRSKEYILSSLTAWDNLMSAMLHLALALNKSEFQTPLMRDEQEVALAHRAARDALVTINLALIHQRVAKAIFFGSKETIKRTPTEAREYALNKMLPKLKVFFTNGGQGFAPDHVDRGETIQGNIFQFTAMLSYWYRKFKLDPENQPSAFVDGLQLNEVQEIMFETIARPMGEGMIEVGRTLTMEETRVRSLKAHREYQQKKKNTKGEGKKKRGKKKNRH